MLGNEIFEALVKKFNKIEPQIIAHTLINIPKEIKTRFKEDISKLDKEHFEEVLDYLSSGKIDKRSDYRYINQENKDVTPNLTKNCE